VRRIASSQHSATSIASAGRYVQVRHRTQAGEMLDRLVRRAVLAEADGIVRQHMDHVGPRNGAVRIAGACSR
jgi:hypothetical protein